MMFSTLQPLLLSVPLAQGESATSLAARLAQRNGARRLISFCSDLGLDHGSLTNGHEPEVRRLAALAGVDPEPLLFSTPWLEAPGWFRLGHERIKFTAFARTKIHACPQCLVDENTTGVQPVFWQLHAIRTCPKHHCLLTTLPLPPSKKEIFDFAFHAAQSRGAVLPVQHVEHSQFETYLLSRIHQGAGDGWLNRLPFHVAAQACENLGALMMFGPERNRDEMTAQDWQRAAPLGLAVLKQGPEGLRDQLKTLPRAVPLDAGQYRSRYRLFFDWLRYRDDDPDFDLLRDLVREFIFQNYPITKGSNVLGKPCPRQIVHSIPTASRVYGVPRWQLGRRLAILGLAERSANGRDFQLKEYIPTATIEQIAKDFSALLSAGEAADWLGVGRSLLTLLTEGGVVAKYFDEKNTLPRYHPRDLDAFMASLAGLASKDPCNDDWLEIPTAAHRLHCPTDRVVRLILNQRIPLRRSPDSESRFRAFRVGLSILQQAMAVPVNGAVTPQVAAASLGVNIYTLRGLLDAGLLTEISAIEPQSGRLRRYVGQADLDRFQRQYITATQLSQITGREPGAEATIQADRGIKRLPLPKRCHTIYHRADVL